ncbi:MAG: hypothetical protein GXO09_06735 [Crenarchaeota archaeon]|nr:hypothetical protein [Thermoproteota archaeon]
MEVWAELEPSSKWEKLGKRAVALLEAGANALDIPEAPLGAPRGYAPIIACLLHERLGARTIPHIRLLDVNLNAVISIAKGLRACGVEELVVLRGDPPLYGEPVNTSSEEAARLVRETVRGVRVGALLSLRHGREKVLGRVRGPFDFFLVTRWVNRLEDLEVAAGEAHEQGKKLVGYLIVGCGEGLERLRRLLQGQPVLGPEEAVELADIVDGLLDAVLVSSPGDVGCLARVISMLRDRAG